MNNAHKKYYFMSGLPRSGSTLLSSILNQNPRIHSGPSSPVVPTMLAIETSLSDDELFLAYPKIEPGKKIISSVIENYYSDVDKPIIIDKNRSWVDKLHYIEGYFNIEPKILYPVRNIDEILTSFITMYRRNPFNGQGKIPFLDEVLVKSNIPLSDDARCNFLCGPNGIVGQSYQGLKKVFEEGRQKHIHLIEYNDLISQPEKVMEKIYDFLEEESFEHNFKQIENIHREKDKEIYGFEDMHEVRPSISKISINPKDVLSDTILAKCKNAEFWRDIDTFDATLENIDTAPTENLLDDFTYQSTYDNKTTLIG